jgi:hypothetical protein
MCNGEKTERLLDKFGKSMYYKYRLFSWYEYGPINALEGDPMPLIDSSENRKKLCHLYNEISKELFGFGTTLLKASLDQNIITIHAKHRRSPRSAALEGEAPTLKHEVDFYMSSIYKKRIREKLEQEMGLSIEAVLRDYDPPTQWAITNVILKLE